MSIPWDDLKLVLAIARTGTLAGAARALGVNHSTVFRRLNGFEDSLGVRLFDRLADGYALTLAGEEMRASAERVEHEIERLDRRIAGQDLSLSGALVVTTTDTVGRGILGPHLADFNAAYPGISLDLVLDNQNVNMSKRQADIAVRPTLDPPEALVGRKICDLAFAPYLTDAYAARHGDGTDRLTWVTVDESLAHLAAAQWFQRTQEKARVALRANSLDGVFIAAKAGIGAGVLPCFMADPDPAFHRITAPIGEAGSALWLLTHEDLRRTARVRAFMDFMADALTADIDLLEGRTAD